MRLPIHLLQEIIGHPVAGFSGAGRKRALGRITIEASAEVFPIEREVLEDPFPVEVHDISAETIGLVSPRAMMPSASLAIRMPLPEGDPLAIRCRVTRCVRQNNGQFALAAQFTELLDAESLEPQYQPQKEEK